MYKDYIRYKYLFKVTDDTNACVPISLTFLLNKPYSEVYKLLQRYGREKGQRTSHYTFFKVMRILERLYGVCTIYKRHYRYSTVTFGNIHKHLEPHKYYLVLSNDHCMPFIGHTNLCPLRHEYKGKKRVLFIFEFPFMSPPYNT